MRRRLYGRALDRRTAPDSRTGDMDTISRHEYQFATDRKAYQVSVLEFASNISQEKRDTAYLGRLVASYARGSGSTLRSQNSTTIGGRSGLEAVTEDPTHDRYYPSTCLRPVRGAIFSLRMAPWAMRRVRTPSDSATHSSCLCSREPGRVSAEDG